MHILGCTATGQDTITAYSSPSARSVELPVILIGVGASTMSAAETISKRKSLISLQPLISVWQLGL